MSFKKSVTFFGLAVLFSFAAVGQSAWPKIQSDMYPYQSDMKLIRHDQSILLGEGVQQTGLFFATAKNTFSEKLQKELIADALQKGWQLHSYFRYGTAYVITLVQDKRILEIRLSNHESGVDAVYSVVFNQVQPKANVSNAMPSSQGTMALAQPTPNRLAAPSSTKPDSN